MDNPSPSSKVLVIKNIYFYLVSFVALMMVVWSVANLINVALKTYVFTKADNFGYYPPAIDCSIATKPIPDANYKPPTPEECQKQADEAKKREEENRSAQRQQDVVRDISMIVVGVPLFFFHWQAVRRKD